MRVIKKIKNKKRALTCLLLNARSIMNKFDHFEVTVNRYDPDIIGITESWCTPSVPDTELQLINYELFRHDRDSENKGGGVLLYVKSKLKPQETSFTPPFKVKYGVKSLICILVFAIILRTTLLLFLTIMIICINYYMKSVKNISS